MVILYKSPYSACPNSSTPQHVYVNLKDLEEKAVALRRELADVEAAIRVEQRYAGAEPIALNPATGRAPKKGSAKEIIAQVLTKRGPLIKSYLVAAIEEEGHKIEIGTINSALYKSGGVFVADDKGRWKLAP